MHGSFAAHHRTRSLFVLRGEVGESLWKRSFDDRIFEKERTKSEILYEARGGIFEFEKGFCGSKEDVSLGFANLEI